MVFIPAYITINFIYGVNTYLPLLIRNLGYQATMVGILLAIAEMAGILGPFLFGRSADRNGKYKRHILGAYAFTVIAALPLAIFVHPILSAVLVAMLVFGHKSAQPLIDAITTINLGEKGNYGKVRISGSIAYVAASFFMQWVPVLRPNVPINIAIWLFVTTMMSIAAIAFVPSRYTTHKPPAKDTQAPSPELQKKSIWTPVFILGLTIIVLSRLSMTPVYTFLPLFMVEYMHWDAVGFVIALSGLSEIPFLFFSYRIIRRFGAMPVMAFSSAMVALRLGLYAVFPFKAGVISAQLLHSFCFGLFHPAAVAFISEYVPPEKRSFGMTLYWSVGWGAPTLIGNFVSGFIVDYAGYRPLFGSFTIFGILGVLIYIVYRARERFYYGQR